MHSDLRIGWLEQKLLGKPLRDNSLNSRGPGNNDMGRLDIEQSSSRGRAGRRKEGKGSTIAIKKEQMKSWNYNQIRANDIKR